MRFIMHYTAVFRTGVCLVLRRAVTIWHMREDHTVQLPGSRKSYQGKLAPARSLAGAAQGGQLQCKCHCIKTDCHWTAAGIGMRQRVLHLVL